MDYKQRYCTKQLSSLSRLVLVLKRLEARKRVRQMRSATVFRSESKPTYFRSMTGERIVRR